jgi:hypothetical protein
VHGYKYNSSPLNNSWETIILEVQFPDANLLHETSHENNLDTQSNDILHGDPDGYRDHVTRKKYLRSKH